MTSLEFKKIQKSNTSLNAATW